MRALSHSARLLHNMKQQRTNDPSLCDVTLRTSDLKSIRCHRAILSANSEFFNKMLTSAFKEATQTEIEVKFEYDVISHVIDYFYDGDIPLNAENCLDLLVASDILLCNDLKVKCVDYVGKNLNQVLGSESMLKTEPTTVTYLTDILKNHLSVNLKTILASIYRWAVEDIETRLTTYLELQMAIFTGLQEDLEVTLRSKVDEPQSSDVFVNFQNIEQNYPHLLKFDGDYWNRCNWPTADDLPVGCDNFCIVEYGRSLLYTTTQGDGVVYREKYCNDLYLERSRDCLLSFSKSERNIYLNKVHRSGDFKLKVFSRRDKSFQQLRLPDGHKLIKLSGNRIAEDSEKNHIFLLATIRINEHIQEGIFCFTFDPETPWNITWVSRLPHKTSDEDSPCVFGRRPVILSGRDHRAYVHREDGDSWKERLSFRVPQLDPGDFVMIYVFCSRQKLYLVVAQDGEVRVVRYDDHCSSGRDVTQETRFPAARLDVERGILFDNQGAQ